MDRRIATDIAQKAAHPGNFAIHRIQNQKKETTNPMDEPALEL
jgi:hypothetical protein